MANINIYFKNQGSGPLPSYLVSFGPYLYEVYEDVAHPSWDVTGWVFPGGFYVGIWDGLLLVTLDVISGAVAPPTTLLLTIEDSSRLVYAGFAGVPQQIYRWRVIGGGFGDLRFRPGSLISDCIPGKW